MVRFGGVFDFARKSDLVGLAFDFARPYWELVQITDAARFLRSIPALNPEKSWNLYIEGTTESIVEVFLERNKASIFEKVPLGTIWPRPNVFYISADPQILEALASLLEASKIDYLCTHTHLYKPGIMLLEWHDAFGGDPMYLSSLLSESQIASFAAALGTTYSRFPNDGSQETHRK